eukprot:TRINITY_DN47884_c0_g1_i1.p3 TRINITY_DN47884_c0_g1~~TRINITY_DN47884_c0_g1_i1.p3  ORF type:complete len:159 (-),score=4.05 TRINITY_DN47884_c0_g1_i1:106-582(-)
MTPQFSVVIPVYNEEANLAELVRRCLVACKGTGKSFELILVDDGSRDKSREMLELASKNNSEIISIILNRNYGQHAAVFAGLEKSCGEIVITLDADLQNPPEEIPTLVDEMEKGVDVVGTVREKRKDSLFRKTSSSIVNQIVRKSTGVMMYDLSLIHI